METPEYKFLIPAVKDFPDEPIKKQRSGTSIKKEKEKPKHSEEEEEYADSEEDEDYEKNKII